MIKRRTIEVLLVRRDEESSEALRCCKGGLRSSKLVDKILKGLSYAAAKQPSSLCSKVPFPKRELAEP